MSLKLINGLFYSEHKLEGIDNEGLIEEITRTYTKGDNMIEGDRPNHKNLDVQHTFYEDCPLSGHFTTQFKNAVLPIADANFGTDSFGLESIWGHFTPPLQTTMVHDHAGSKNDLLQLSWVYYPHQPKDCGYIHFIGQAGGARVQYEVKTKPSHLYMFASDVLHYVPRNGSGENRISVSGNLESTPHFRNVIQSDHEFSNNYWYFVGRDEKLLDD